MSVSVRKQCHLCGCVARLDLRDEPRFGALRPGDECFVCSRSVDRIVTGNILRNIVWFVAILCLAILWRCQ